VAQFGLIGLLGVTLLGFVGAQRLRSESESEAILEARERAVALADGIVAPRMTSAALRGEPDALAELDRVARAFVVKDPVSRLKVWDMSGRVVYADDARLIGRTFELDREAMEAAARGLPFADVTDLSDAENEFERGSGKLLEVYRPIRAVDGTPLLYEHYPRFSAVTQGARRIWSFTAPLLLQLVQLPLAWTLGRRVRDAQRQHTDLLQQALDASDTERRRIARDLHDGAVQDLIGVAYTLGAVLQESALQESALQGAPAVTVALRDAREGTQRSIRGLRTLLVDIYPPNLAEGDLVGALHDLAAPYEAKGIVATVTTNVTGDVGPTTSTLVYRAVREALANVAKHAHASRVDVALLDDPLGGIELRVSDDGVGFDTATLAGRRDEGHLGLRLLGDLADHAGGTIEVRSAMGAGTTVVLRAPR
jgi:two-component system, NarL family, sensor kinase